MSDHQEEGNGLFEVYARVILPPHLYHRQGDPLSSTRHGVTVVELLDGDGNHVGYLRGIQGAKIFTSDNDFMRVSIDVIAEVDLPEEG